MAIFTTVELQQVADLKGVGRLSSQEERIILTFVNTGNVRSAAAAGGVTVKDATSFLEHEEVQPLLQHFEERNKENFEISKDAVTRMFLEAYHTAATSGEKVQATKELARLYDLYGEKHADRSATSKSGTNIQINTTNNSFSNKQLERMTDQQLLELAGDHLPSEYCIVADERRPNPPPPPGYDPVLDI